MDAGATLEDAIETIEFIGGDNSNDALLMLNMPFELNPSYRPSPTRFSDGTWRVFYSALEVETAEKERGYWCLREIQSDPPALRHFHYRELRCRLQGEAYDVKAKLADWPFLVGDHSAYAQCQNVARAAIQADADALIAPSARKNGGTTIPVFKRVALSSPEILGAVIFQVQADGSFTIIRQPA
ncbi:RES family NAD+ phosphorylase [Bradyrhizobium sp.]|uniref:RES family NAD+ phosphorylase n=1 Tax=Bradyrhizobium sp. TaxID=376 RepID=UPI003C543187